MPSTSYRLLFSVALACLSLSVSAQAQTSTFHLHQESSYSGGLYQLKASGPDTSTKIWSALPHAGATTTVRVFDLPGNTPALGGVIPKGTTFSFIMWMRVTGTLGTVYPAASMAVNFAGQKPSQLLCSARGTTALTMTLAAYTFNCVVNSNVPVLESDRLTLFAEFYTQSYTPGKGKNGTMSVELGVEGTSGAAANSRVTMTVPTTPRITGVSPLVGAPGDVLTISGANFGSTQGASTVSIGGVTVVPTSWAANQVTAVVPAGLQRGPVRVTVGASSSNPWMFFGTWDPAQCQPALSSSRIDLSTPLSTTAQVDVTAAPSCAWSIESLPAWLSAAPPAGTGTTNIILSALENALESARYGQGLVNGVPFAVAQPGIFGNPVFIVRTLSAPTVSVVGGVATCSVTINLGATSGTPVFVGLDLSAGGQLIAMTTGVGTAFTMSTSATAPAGPVSCVLYSIPDGFVVNEGAAP